MDNRVKAISLAVIIVGVIYLAAHKYNERTARQDQTARQNLAAGFETKQENLRILNRNQLEEYYKNLSQITNELASIQRDLQQCNINVASKDEACEIRLQTELKVERKCTADREAVVDRHEQKLNSERNQIKEDCRKEQDKVQNEYDRHNMFFEQTKTEITRQLGIVKEGLSTCIQADSQRGIVYHLQGLIKSLVNFIPNPARLAIGI